MRETGNYIEARKSFVVGLHEEVWKAGWRFVLPLVLISYGANYFARPCWQSLTLAVAALAHWLGWYVAARLVRSGRIEAGVRTLTTTSMAFIGLVAMLREGAVVTTVITLPALLTYVSLFSFQFLLPAAAIQVVIGATAMLVGHYGLIERFAQSPRAVLFQSVAYIVIMVPVIAYFLRAGQRVSEQLYRETLAAAERQASALQTLERIEPEISGAVESIRQISLALAARAAEQAQTSARMLDGTSQLSNLVAESTSSAAEARREAEEVLERSVQGQQRLREVERSFQEAVGRIDAVRGALDGLASEIGRTEQINGAIGEIAANLQVLSVNASLEAARAGEVGKGFAVIAHELQRMIAQTGSDLRSSSKLLEEVRGATVNLARESDASTGALRGTLDQFVATSALVQGMAESFSKGSGRLDALAASAERHRERIQEIAAATRQFEEAAGEMGRATATLTAGVGRIDGAARQLREALTRA